MFINTVDSAQMKFKYMSRKINFNLWFRFIVHFNKSVNCDGLKICFY